MCVEQEIEQGLLRGVEVRELHVERKILSVAAKKGTSLAVETEPGAGLRSGPRWAQE